MSDGATRPRQRWQILFSRGAPALRMRQPQLIGEFERAFREAGLPLSYTSAKRPRPRVQLAANLPVGVELRGEVVEAYFDELVPIDRIRAAGELFPEGVAMLEAREVWHGFPSAASQVRAAEYLVEVEPGDETALSDEKLREAVVRLLAKKALPGAAARGETERRADVLSRDLRPLIEDVEVVEVGPGGRTATLRCVLRLDASGAGRPEEVVRSLEVPLRTRRAVRSRLLFVDTPPIAR